MGEEKKGAVEKFKEMINYGDDIYQNNGKRFIDLERKIERNESYVNFVLYFAKENLLKNKKITIKEISKSIEQGTNYVYKMLELFLSEELIFVVKRQNKNYYQINMDEESLKHFMVLFKKAKETKETEGKYGDKRSKF